MVDDTLRGVRPQPAGVQSQTAARTAGPTSGVGVAISDIRNRIISYPYVPREAHTQTLQQNLAGTASTTLADAAGAGIFRDIVGIVVTNLNVTNQRISIKDGEGAGTTALVLQATTIDADDNALPLVFPMPLKAAAVNTPWLLNQPASSSGIQVLTFTIDHY